MRLTIPFAVLVTCIPLTLAAERIRLYNEGEKVPEYTGNAESQPDGSLRFYDKKGRYTGKLQDGRLINKKGRVVEKLYRLPKH